MQNYSKYKKVYKIIMQRDQKKSINIETEIKAEISAIRAILRRHPTEPSTPEYQKKKFFNPVHQIENFSEEKLKELYTLNHSLVKENAKMKKMLIHERKERRSLETQLESHCKQIKSLNNSHKTKMEQSKKSQDFSFQGYQFSDFRGRSSSKPENLSAWNSFIGQSKRKNQSNNRISIEKKFQSDDFGHDERRDFQDSEKSSEKQMLENQLSILIQKSNEEQNRARKLKIRHKMSKIAAKIRLLRDLS